MKNRIYYLLLSIVGGLMFGFAWPGTGGLTPFLFVGLVPLLYIQDQLQASAKKGMLGYAYITFLVWHLVSVWWVYCVSEALVTKIVSLGAPALINPLFMIIIWNWFNKTKKRIGTMQGYVGLIVYWIGFEYLHLNWSLSYPWLNFGNGFSDSVEWIQWYEYTGAFGGTLWVLLSNIIFYRLIKSWMEKSNSAHQFRLRMASISILIVPLLISYGMYYSYSETENPAEIVIVQPNIDPYHEKCSRLGRSKRQNDEILQ